MAWEGSFIRCFTESEAEYTLESELYALIACGENRITDMNNVQQASACQGVFYIQKFFQKFLLPPEHQPIAIWQIQRKGKRRIPLSRHNGGGGELV